MDVSVLFALAEPLSVLPPPAAPDRRETLEVGGRVTRWAGAMGLLRGDPDSCPLGRARVERLACRAFPEADPDRVALFAQWLLWLFAVDDAIDETAVGRSATSVHGLFGDLLRALRSGAARPEARPLEIALVDLWRRTTPGMTRSWRRRFVTHLEEHRDGCAEEAVNRRTGRVPPVDGYSALRRRAAGPFVYDLAEPVLGVELPPGRERAWHALRAAAADIITWSNDVVSYRKESGRGDPHNYVAVLTAGYGFAPEQAAGWVVEYIAQRAADLRAAARSLEAGPVARGLLGAPPAHLEWLAESGRYTVPAVPPPREPRAPREPRTSASPSSVRT